MKLHYKTYFEHWHPEQCERSPIVIIPGLFGATGNWRGFAQKLSPYAPIIVIDQRNHGQSPHSPNNSYFDLVTDLIELLDLLGINKATLCGHSMGGKTAMVFALTEPQRLDQLIVMDIAPVEYAHSHAPILQALKDIDLASATSRFDVEEKLMGSIPDKSTRLFIMLSLARNNGDFTWKINVDGLYDNLPLIGGFPSEELLNTQFLDDCLFIKAADSDYITDEYCETIQRFFPNSSMQTVSNAGHWLHIDQQDVVVDHALTFLNK